MQIVARTHTSYAGEGPLLSSLAVASKFYDDNVAIALHDDQDVEHETAAGLIKTILSSLQLQQMTGAKTYRCRLNDEQGLHVAILSSSLSMALRCSRDILSTQVSGFQDDLILALSKISDLFATWNGDITIQQVVLDATIKIVDSVRPHMRKRVGHLVDFLIQILKGNVSADIRLEAACTVVRFLRESDSTDTTRICLAKVEENASSLISTLSTVSLAAASNETQSSEYLYQLAETSRVLISKMARRRGTILVVVKDLLHEEEDIRELALHFCASLLKCPESVQSLTTGLEGNADILIDALTNSAQDEPEGSLRLMAIALLRKVVSIENLRSESAMHALQSISERGETDDEVILAATAYCRGTRNCPYSLEMLETTVNFTTSPYEPVRAEALATLEAITFDPACVSLLVEETDMLENFSLIVQHGSQEDCTNALNIARQVARSSSYHEALCSHSNFLGAVIEWVAKDKPVANEAHNYGVEFLLSLLSNATNTDAFLSFPQLLPWLVTFVATTGDEDFKQEVITAIVRLSEALLE